MDYQYQKNYYLIMREEDERLHKYYNKLTIKTTITEPRNDIGIRPTKKGTTKEKACKAFQDQLNSTSFRENNSETVDANQGRKPDRLSGKNYASSQDSGVPKLVSSNNVTSVPNENKENTPLPPEIGINNTKLHKYYAKRLSLFSKFNEGVKLDEESWYSVTPELAAKEIAERCKCNVIIDAFCGAGGNTIQFAITCNKVIAIDIDKKKIELARNNAQVYGVAHKIQFIVGDFLKLASSLKADIVFLSPPWGGPNYAYEKVYNLETMLRPVPYSKLLYATRQISSRIAAYLPRNSKVEKNEDSNTQVEVKRTYNHKKLLAITVYYNIPLKENR